MLYARNKHYSYIELTIIIGIVSILLAPIHSSPFVPTTPGYFGACKLTLTKIKSEWHMRIIRRWATPTSCLTRSPSVILQTTCWRSAQYYQRMRCVRSQTFSCVSRDLSIFWQTIQQLLASKSLLLVPSDICDFLLSIIHLVALTTSKSTSWVPFIRSRRHMHDSKQRLWYLSDISPSRDLEIICRWSGYCKC